MRTNDGSPLVPGPERATSGPVVVTVDAASVAHVVPVDLLARGAESVLVKGKGLSAGAQVAVEGNYNLPDGAHVVVERGEGHEAPDPQGSGGR